MPKLTHVDEDGKAAMVDIGAKRITRRRALASGRVCMNRRAFTALRDNKLAKGDAFGVARLAAIQAAKRTADWIPLCHSVPLEQVQVDFELDEPGQSVEVQAVAAASWRTGVEMEALVAVSAACLALYDMAKALDRGIRIVQLQLESKSGGRSGTWKRSRAAAQRRRS